MPRDPIRLIFAAASLCAAFRAHATEPMSLKAYMALRGPAPTEQISYGPAPHQVVEWFKPSGAGPFAVAILIHGGCFLNQFEGLPQMGGMAGALAARGVAVWNIDYRGLDTAGGGYPGTFLDVRAALDLIAAQASARKLDLHRLVLVGHSAGSVLALWAAGRAKLPPSSPLHEALPLAIHQVVALGATADFRTSADEAYRTHCEIDPTRLTGSPTEARPDVFADTNPFDLTPNGSQTLFVNGDHDTIMTPQESAGYAARVRERGDAVDTLVLPNASHFDEVATTSPAWALVEPAILKALGIR